MDKRVTWLDAFQILFGRALPDRRSTALLIGFFVLLFTGLAVADSACYPWAHSLGFWPTLTGTWVGEFTAAGRGKHVALVDLRDDISDDAGPDLKGLVKVCDSRGETHQFGLSGTTLNWRGSRLRFTTFITESHDRDGEGVKLGRIDAEWDRGDTLNATAKLELWRIRNGGTFSSTDRPPAQIALEDTPVQFMMRRGREEQFRAACEQLPSKAR